MATGVSEDEAKTDLCRAVADRKIDVRVRIAASDYGMRGRTFSDGNVGVPAHLEPRDFDWVQSRPLKPWLIGPKRGEHYAWDWENRPLDLIELSTGEVTKILCTGHPPHLRPPDRRIEGRPSPAARSLATSQTTARPTRARPAIERAQRIINELYPNGVPDQTIVPNTTLCQQVGAKLMEYKLPAVSDDTILRAAGRRK
ncbi:hypothetical protein ACRQ5Q_38300 [Bradyrhizobium sp. PMVTL-01]|uniref:hypothetical protein n=1 Tax=Bradyrhizobium sp. PMVTL-01 TaxID=3434999 RepID=UPI003F72EAF4